MSWRSSGNFRPGGQSSRPSFGGGGGQGGPPLIDPMFLKIGIAVIVCVAAVGIIAALVSMSVPSSQTAESPAAPAEVAPTAAPAEPTAAPEPTAASAEAPAAPAAPAGVPSEPYGPAITTGTGTAITLGTDLIDLVFDQDTLTVPDGPVTLTFNNDAMAVQHNWVLVEAGDEEMIAAINQAAADQSRTLRLPEAAVPPPDTPGVLAVTPMLDMGESITFTFEPPGPGTYTFICTFPGHYEGGMVGTLIVEP
ncbi:MAG: auracyanin [Candidatus Viridilinea halotolerans]|uniref:Auracyanin n=1 Tax=Candidatus Viridilinea halotolerans TaxID=2491704 RepID=A0A426TZT6_9CHLR|nr:MAG: auracyanin [Candidatus Viridilinea halotolerans]